MKKEQSIKPFPAHDGVFDPDECVRHAQDQEYAIDREDVLTVNILLDLITEHFNISRDLILGKKRTKNIMLARHAFRAIMIETTDFAQVIIGGFSGGVDHSTVCHSKNAYQEIIDLRDIRDDSRKYADCCTKIIFELNRRSAQKLASVALPVQEIYDQRSWGEGLLKRFSEFFPKRFTDGEIEQFLNQDVILNTPLKQTG